VQVVPRREKTLDCKKKRVAHDHQKKEVEFPFGEGTRKEEGGLARRTNQKKRGHWRRRAISFSAGGNTGRLAFLEGLRLTYLGEKKGKRNCDGKKSESVKRTFQGRDKSKKGASMEKKFPANEKGGGRLKKTGSLLSHQNRQGEGEGLRSAKTRKKPDKGKGTEKALSFLERKVILKEQGKKGAPRGKTAGSSTQREKNAGEGKRTQKEGIGMQNVRRSAWAIAYQQRGGQQREPRSKKC